MSGNDKCSNSTCGNSGSESSSPPSKIDKGKRSEALICGWLKSKGYSIVQRNFYCRFGEVDIIAAKEDMLYLVEVRSRFLKEVGIDRNKMRGAFSRRRLERVMDEALRSVSLYKRSKVIQAGYFFLNSTRGARWVDKDLNFMAVLVVWKDLKKVFIRSLVC